MTLRSVRLASLLLVAACAGQPPVFRVEPVRPVAELRAEALRATPPAEPAPARAADLVELVTLDSTIRLDIRYATDRNFLGTPVYSQARAFLQRPAAEALVRAHRALAAEGYGLLVHDAYRPWYVTRIFWDATPPAQREFVADPAQGSKHNRGAAVDLTLYDRRTGRAVEMPSLYDEFSERAYADWPGGTAEQRRLRGLLRAAMEREGFAVVRNEWWHFDHRDWRAYGLGNQRFEELGPAEGR
jgi:D-alanyl-D-alanine dipeptidase